MGASPPAAAPQPHRYVGSVTLNSQTVQSPIKEITSEVLSHPQSIYGARVKVTLEIEVDVPDGIPGDKRQIVESRSAELRFDQSEFID